MLRQLLINNGIAYGEGVYGSGLYGGFSEVKIADNWKFQKSINSQAPFTFTIINNPDLIEIKKGLEVRFLIDNIKKFAGIILKIIPYEPIPNYLYYDVTCATFVKLIAKRRFGAVFENKTAPFSPCLSCTVTRVSLSPANGWLNDSALSISKNRNEPAVAGPGAAGFLVRARR